MVHICSDCAHINVPQRHRRGSGHTELRLWCCLILPGLFYSLWRWTTLHWACPQCHSRRLIRIDTPAGKRLAAEAQSGPAVVRDA